ncbi:MAG: ribonuclease P protein component [Sphingobacteriales bacterium]|nr:MAG: ribonuclease P protein component [Sphingobacteriales bacterium]
MKGNQTLGSGERLKSRKIIELLFKEGKSVAAHPVRITYKVTVSQLASESVLKSDVNQDISSFLQAGFSVSSRNFKKAVDRNRIKRLLRESYRKQKSTLHELLTGRSASVSIAIFIIYTGKELPVYEFVDEKMKSALKKLSAELEKQVNG